MAKPLTIKLTGTFEMKDTISLKELQEVIAECQAQLEEGIGPGALVVTLGRQKLIA